MSNQLTRGRRAAVAAAGGVLALAGSALASSHSEAPFITELRKVDATDFYMFNSYEPGRDGYVTIIANYYPLQAPYGGPNYFQLDPDGLYQVHIDNNGDAREDITFSFRFTNSLRQIALNVGGVAVPIPLIQAGTIGPGVDDNAALNVVESYTLDLVYGDQYYGTRIPVRNAATGATVFRKPVDSIGEKSVPNYETYARNHIFEISLPGLKQTGRVFVGQRDDPFQINLGEVFDLVNLNPVGAPDAKRDILDDANVTSLIIEVPAAFVTRGSDSVIGGWTTSSLPRTRVLNMNPTFLKPAYEAGNWVQVSRLGMALVNEVVIGLPDKDRFNNSRPRDDLQFATYVTNPTLPALLNALFGVTAPCLPRNDLVTAFLTGVPGLNQPANVVASEMLRLNTATPVTPRGMQSSLGVLGGDLAGYPNGRRPGDDVVDISLRVAMGAIIPDAGQPGGCAPSGTLPFTDQTAISDGDFDNFFPYIRTPVPGSPNN
jgi:hypothetical protein